MTQEPEKERTEFELYLEEDLEEELFNDNPAYEEQMDICATCNLPYDECDCKLF